MAFEKKACVFWEMDPESQKNFQTKKDAFKMPAQNFDTQKSFFSIHQKCAVYSSVSESFSSVA